MSRVAVTIAAVKLTEARACPVKGRTIRALPNTVGSVPGREPASTGDTTLKPQDPRRSGHCIRATRCPCARTVKGGTPFGFNDRSDANPFGTFKEVGKGGKIVVMGDGMVSLYMTSWEGIQDYQCQEFMQDVFRWLLKE